MVGTVVIGENSRKTHIWFKKINHYQAYINSIDQGYKSEDSVSNSCFYSLNTPQFNIVKRSQKGKGCDFKDEIFEYRGGSCFKPAKGYCFFKCTNCFFGNVYKQQY